VSSSKKTKAPRPVKEKPVEKRVVDQVVQPAESNFFERVGKKGGLIALGALVIICFLVFKDYLLKDKSYFFKDIGSDSYNYIYPYLYQLAEYIPKYGVPKWSFNYGMGQNLFPFFLRDPFYFLLIISGKDNILFGLILKEVAKIILGGITFYCYLKTLKLSNYTSLIGCILYSFCGFTILGSGWQIFSFDSFNLALLMLSFELLYSKRNWYFFPIAIFLTAIAQPFNLFHYGLFLALYAILRMYQDGTLSPKRAGILLAQMVGLGVVGLLASAPFLLENIVQMLESPRGAGGNSYAAILSSTPAFKTADATLFGTSVMRLFSSDMLGTGNDFKGWQNYLEAPLFYCGTLTLLLVPQVFQFLEKRTKIIFGVFLALWLLPTVFPYFRYAFWLFTGDYFRTYCILVVWVLLYYALLALNIIIEKRKVNLIVLGTTLLFLFVLLNYPYFTENNMHPGVSIFVSFMIVVYAVLIFFIGRAKQLASLKYAMLVAVMLEAIYLSGRTVNERDPVSASDITERKGYNDHTIDAVAAIAKNDKTAFYRIDKTYASSTAIHYSLNDAMVQNFYGTAAYNPFNQLYYIYYLQLMGISDKKDELQSRWATGLSNRPILESENQVKYMLAKTQANPLWQVMCDTIGTYGDVHVFRNKFTLPLGYTYTKYVKESVFSNLTNVQKDFVSLKACVVKDEDVTKLAGMKEFNMTDTVAPNAFTFDLYRQDVTALSTDTMAVTKFDQNDIAGKINCTNNEIMYLSVPYDGGWHLKVDGKETDKRIVFAGMTGVILSPGQHAIEMHYDLRYFYKGLILALLGILAYAGLFAVQLMKKKKTTSEA
jgi:uncharacterized membrane protein YfhO